MRVQATEVTPTYSMGKNKKHKIRKTKEASDSSDDGAIPTCNHVNMSVNFAQMKKLFGKQTFGECSSCNKEPVGNRRSDSTASTTEDSLLDNAETSLWVCLQCGHQGCGRNSIDKHALKHYETPRSSSHCIAVNTYSWSVWCYKCDDVVPIEKNKKMIECVDYLRKQSGLPVIDSAKKASGSGASAGSSLDHVKETSNRPLTPKSQTPGICHKLKGLSNLGNTCFFNAVMQNISQTQCLETLVQERSKKGRSVNIDGKQLTDTDDSSDDEESNKESPTIKEMPPIEIVLPGAGPLTQSLVGFLQEMNNSSNRSSTVNPSVLFDQVCKKAQRFRGYQQQDSHELLRYLLDSMKMEEVKRSQSAILKYFKVPENVNPKKVPEETKFKIKEYGRLVKHTFVDAMFGGHLLSTVLCEECKHISQIFEPFLDLSLPVTEEKPTRPNQAQSVRKKDSVDKEENESAVTDTGKTYKATRPSKHETKKLKRQAKKDAKKKFKIQKDKVTSEDGKQEGEGDESPEGVGDEEDDDEEENKTEDRKSGDQEDNSSNKECPSDADIEDNLESDTSRCNRFGPLGDEMDSSINLQKNEDDLTLSLSEKGITSPMTSSTSTLQADSCSSNFTNTDSNHTLNEAESSNGDVNENDPIDILKPKVIENATTVLGASGFDNQYCNGDINDEVNTENINGLRNSGELRGHFEVDSVEKNEINGHVSSENCKMKEIDNLSNKMENVTISSTHFENERQNGTVQDSESEIKIENGINGHEKELTSKLKNLKIDTEKDNICSQKLEIKNNEDENTSKQNDLSKQMDDDKLIRNNKKNSPPLSRQGSATHSNLKGNLKQEAQLKSTTTLGSHYIPSSRECSIMSCLHQFTSAELLTGNNKFGCPNCTKIRNKHHSNTEKKGMVYSNASKYYLIYSPPPILTLHLKRFEQVGFTSRKVNRHVDFPFVLDLAPFCSSLCQGVKPSQRKILYSLYGVVEHSGRLNAGHYTAYVKVRPNIGIISNFLNHGSPSFNDYIERYEQSIKNSLKEEEDEEIQEEKLVPPGRWYHISDSRVSEATESTVQRAQAYLLFYERIY